MMFDDTKLFKSDGSFDFQYVLEWLHSVKDVYDLADFFNDRKDIENLLNASSEDIAAIERKIAELESAEKYGLQLNFFKSLCSSCHCSTNTQLSPKEKLLIFKKHLPILELMKRGLNKVLEEEIKKIYLGKRS